jgi:hypothetical protein
MLEPRAQQALVRLTRMRQTVKQLQVRWASVLGTGAPALAVAFTEFLTMMFMSPQRRNVPVNKPHLIAKLYAAQLLLLLPVTLRTRR